MGELDVASAPLLEKELRRAETVGASTLCLDLSGVTFMDAAGMRVMQRAAARDSSAARPMRVTRPARRIGRILIIIGFEQALELVDDMTGPACRSAFGA